MSCSNTAQNMKNDKQHYSIVHIKNLYPIINKYSIIQNMLYINIYISEYYKIWRLYQCFFYAFRNKYDV